MTIAVGPVGIIAGGPFKPFFGLSGADLLPKPYALGTEKIPGIRTGSSCPHFTAMAVESRSTMRRQGVHLKLR
jgi:hypothetical protein